MRMTTAMLAVACALGAAGAPAGSAAPAGKDRVCAAGEVRWLERWDRAYAGRIKAPTTVFRRPGADPFLRLEIVDKYRFWTTVPIVAQLVDRRCRPTWFRVRLRHYPNGTLGWVRAGTMTTSRIRARIVVDLSQRRLFFYKQGRLVLSAPAAVGTSGTPTPTGKFFVTQRWVLKDPNGPFGARLLSVSAFSDVLRWWREGGPIGIHGTNDGSSIGRRASHGCVRLPASAMLELFKDVPLATPVTIRE